MFKLFKRSAGILENPNIPISEGIKNAHYIIDGITNGVTVDAKSVMGHPFVRGGVSLYANLAGSLPISVMIDGGDQGRQQDLASPWHRSLAMGPTGNCTRVTWMQTVVRETIIYGNAYYLIDDIDHRLIWLDPSVTSVKTNGFDVVYKTTLNGVPRTFDRSQVIHIRSLSDDGGLTGEPLYEALRSCMAAALSKFEHVRKHFENGTFSNLVWVMPPGLSKEKQEQYQKIVKENSSGVINAGKDLFIGAGGDIKPLQASNTVSQTRELMEFDILVISAALYGLPADALGADANTSYNAQEINDTRFLRNINWLLTQIESELSTKLLTIEDNLTGKRWIEFKRYATQEMDKVTELELLDKQLASGSISLEYHRRKLNNPIEYIDGETYFHPSNAVKFIAGEPEPQPEPEVTEDKPEVETEEEAEEPEVTEDRSDPRLQSLVEANLRRLVERVARGAKPARDHKEVWLEAFGMFDQAEAKLQQLGNLIDGATESRAAIASNLDLSQWAAELIAPGVNKV